MTRLADTPHPAWCGNLISASRLQRGERVLITVDEPNLEVGAQLMAAVEDAGARPHLVLWSGFAPVEHGIASDVSIFIAAEPKVEEAPERFMLAQSVTRRGGRQLFLGFVDRELLENELSEPGVDLAQEARGVLEQLAGCRTLRVRGRAGTDLTLAVADRPWLTDALPLAAGGVANYPGGEVFVAPHSDGADGVLVADVTVPYTVDGLVDEPVALRFERGRVTSIEGGRAAQMLRELVADAGTGADVIAELGIGLNPSVRPRGHVMLDEKAAATAHVAIGNNVGPLGGDNAAEIHVDCVFSAPTLEADGRRVQLP